MGTSPFIVLVLGMHRSGTSCLAGCLERSGVTLGDVRRKGRHNLRGYYELSQVQRLNDQILSLNRGSWHQPPKRIKVHPHHSNRIRKIGRRLSVYSPCGIKDPRLLLIEEWKRFLPLPVKLIGTFRHPEAVARSLKIRNGMPLEKGIALWKHYNESLIKIHQKNPFPIIEFNLLDVRGYCENIANIACQMGLSVKKAQLRYFVTQDLDHHRSEDMGIPESCRRIYAYLRETQTVSLKKTHPLPTASTKTEDLALYTMGAAQELAFKAWCLILDRHHKI